MLYLLHRRLTVTVFPTTKEKRKPPNTYTDDSYLICQVPILFGHAMEIEKSKTALVVIDLQKGIAERETVPYDPKTVISNAAMLADKFRENRMPVFLVHVIPNPELALHPKCDSLWQLSGQISPDFSDIVPELGPKGSDIVITKMQWGAFYGTDLEMQLRRRGIGTIVLCGISTDIGVESTARFAYEYGFNLIFAEDAMSSITASAHSNSTEGVFKRMGYVRKTAEILALL